jgi:membrane protein DedA with SNARE-associated domain
MSDWISTTMEQFGYLGVLLLMLLENIFPPIPSEVVMPMAGFSSRQGELTLLGVIAAGTLGSLLGALPWYYVGRRLGEKRFREWLEHYERWLPISMSEYHRTQRWFDQHGGITVLVCRLVPGVRTLISVPAGFAKMAFLPFMLFTTIGTALWTALLAWLGWTLGDNHALVDRYAGWLGAIVLLLLAAWWAVRVVRRWKPARDAS